MKKMIVAAAVCLGVMAFSPVTQAQEDSPGSYTGIGAGLFSLGYQNTTVHQRSTVFGGYAQFGHDLTPYVGGELRFGGTGSGKKYYTGQAVTSRELSGNYFISYLAKFQYPVDVGVTVYALVGGTTAKFRMSTNANRMSATKTGLSYGAGLDYSLGDRLSAGIEWVQYWVGVRLGATFGTNAKANISGAVARIAYHY